jgi:hypothetical protein
MAPFDSPELLGLIISRHNHPLTSSLCGGYPNPAKSGVDKNGGSDGPASIRWSMFMLALLCFGGMLEETRMTSC